MNDYILDIQICEDNIQKHEQSQFCQKDKKPKFRMIWNIGQTKKIKKMKQISRKNKKGKKETCQRIKKKQNQYQENSIKINMNRNFWKNKISKREERRS